MPLLLALHHFFVNKRPLDTTQFLQAELLDVEPTSQYAADEPCTNLFGMLLNNFVNFRECPSNG
jgi:hypothetical protein